MSVTAPDTDYNIGWIQDKYPQLLKHLQTKCGKNVTGDELMNILKQIFSDNNMALVPRDTYNGILQYLQYIGKQKKLFDILSDTRFSLMNTLLKLDNSKTFQQIMAKNINSLIGKIYINGTGEPYSDIMNISRVIYGSAQGNNQPTTDLPTTEPSIIPSTVSTGMRLPEPSVKEFMIGINKGNKGNKGTVGNYMNIFQDISDFASLSKAAVQEIDQLLQEMGSISMDQFGINSLRNNIQIKIKDGETSTDMISQFQQNYFDQKTSQNLLDLYKIWRQIQIEKLSAVALTKIDQPIKERPVTVTINKVINKTNSTTKRITKGTTKGTSKGTSK